MQSGTAYMEMSGSLELRGAGVSGTFAALKYVRRRIELGPVREDLTLADGLLLGGEEPGSVHGGGGPTENYETAELISERAGLAHDVGNLLGALSLYADLLSSPGVLHEDYVEYASDLRLLSERGAEMLTRLLEGDAERRHPEDDQVSVLPEVLRDMRGLLERLAGCAVQLEFDEGSSVPVMVSREVVERVAANLVKNAGEAIDHDAGAIAIWIGQASNAEPARVAMRVCDNGRGMTEVQLGSLGDAVRGAKGRGIGFRVVRELVEMSSGVLGIASALGEGTMVEVEWRAQPQQKCRIAHIV